MCLKQGCGDHDGLCHAADLRSGSVGGNEGVYALSVISGFVDVDAITRSLSRSATYDLGTEVAAMGIVLAAASNTLVKGLIFAFIGGFRDTIRLPVFVLAAILPGVMIAVYLL